MSPSHRTHPAGGATAALPSTPAPTLPPAGGRSDGLPPGHPEIPAEDAAQVGIQWLGGYCFYIHSPGGVAVVTDPFDPKAAGLPPPETGAHFVTVSEDSPLHANVEAIHEFQGEKREVLRGTGAQRGDLQITPVPLEPGKRWAYVIQAGPLRIAHLGALTKPLTPEQAARLGKVDVLMLPAGGQGLSPKDAVAVAQRVAPRLIVPMAYADPMMQGATARLLPLEKFVAASPFAVTQKDSDVTMVGRSDLPPSPEILALKFRR
jgi:L-ascorbate metabolism protein UlaG (beta-lactamase superfamily)